MAVEFPRPEQTAAVHGLRRERRGRKVQRERRHRNQPEPDEKVVEGVVQPGMAHQRQGEVRVGVADQQRGGEVRT